MTPKRLWFVGLILASLACNTVTRVFGTPTPTPEPIPPTNAAPTETTAPEATATPEPPPTPEVYVPPGCENQPLATLPPETTLALPESTLEADAPISPDVQLRVFDDLVARIEQVYLYPDFNGLDWAGLKAAYRAKVTGGLDTEAFYTEMRQLVIDLGDEHSRFESPVEVAASERDLSGENDYVGVGIYVQPLIEKERITILTVFPDSPAFYAGLKAHDSILSVDGLPIVENGVPQTHRVRGPECSAVVLEVQSPGEAPRAITLMRQRIVQALPIDARLVPTSDGSRIGYIFLPTFFDETIPGQVRAALDDFGALDGLILDNRMNGGGSSTVVEPILSHFASGHVGHFATRNDQHPFEVAGDPVHNSQTVPLVVLVGKDTVSFGEIFSGVLQDIGRAKLVGQTTDGNVETLHGYYFEDGSRVYIAEERFVPLNSGADWEKDGVVPDVEAYADWDTFVFETDPSVAAAVALLRDQ